MSKYARGEQKRKRGKQKFEDIVKASGWTLGQDYNYINCVIAVPLICPKGHIIEKPPSYFINCPRCSICSGRSPKYVREEFEKQIKQKNWKLASDYCYKNVDTKVSLICDNGHHIYKTPWNVKIGTGCPICVGTSSEYSQEEFERQVIERHWTFGPDYEYTNAKTKVVLFCDKGHRADKTPSSLKQGFGCAICSGHDMSCAEERFTIAVELRGWELVNDFEYKGAHENVSLFCDKGHRIDKTPHSFLAETGCIICSFETKHELAKQEFNHLVDQIGWKIVEGYEYEGSTTVIPLICDKGHRADKLPRDLTRGNRCGICSKRSYSQKAIHWLNSIAYCQKIFIQHAENMGEYKIPNTALRVDGYCKEWNAVFEFHGTYYHGHPDYFDPNEIFMKDKTFGEMYNKTLAKESKIQELGYRLYVVWEHEWDKRIKTLPSVEVDILEFEDD